MKHYCLICKYMGNHSVLATSSNGFYASGTTKTLHLCTPHSLDYFKHGQCGFFRMYKHVFEGRFGTELDDGILREVEKIHQRDSKIAS